MKKWRFHEKGFKYARGGRLLSSIQSGAVRAWGGEGSTCPLRGKLWSTVYRAHASKFEAQRNQFLTALTLCACSRVSCGCTRSARATLRLYMACRDGDSSPLEE